MVALALFAMVVTAVYATWVIILKSSTVGQEAASQVQRERIAVRTIEDSLTCIQSFQASMVYYGFLVQNGTEPVLSYTARLPDDFARNGRFDTGLRRLTFTVETGPDADNKDEKDLVLRQKPILTDIDTDEQSYPLVLARNVKSFIVECWDTNKLDWADEWLDTNSIPTMVRVSLTLGGNVTDRGGTANTLTITREIAMPSMTMPRVVQTGSPGGGGGGGNPGPAINGINGAGGGINGGGANGGGRGGNNNSGRGGNNGGNNNGGLGGQGGRGGFGGQNGPGGPGGFGGGRRGGGQ